MTGRDGGAKKKILLVDDHPLLRKGLAQLINQQKDLAVCGEAEEAADALKLIETLQPDLAVVDISLRDSSGIELIKDFRIRAPNMLVLVLSMHDEVVYADRVLKLGARGYVSKKEDPDRVIEGIHRLLKGEVFISKEVSSRILQKFVGNRGDAEGASVDHLSDREFGVLEMIGHGLSTREIAEKLHLSVKTVEAHRENIKRKLKLSGAAEVRKYAIHWVQMQDGQ